MSENQTPVTGAPAPQSTPAVEGQTPVVAATPEVAGTPATPSEKKADAAADQAGAEKIAKDLYEIKVDGEVHQLTKEQMIEWAQKGRAGQKKMEEAAKMQQMMAQKFQEIVKTLKENPDALLEDPAIGHKKIELAKKWLAAQMEEDAKDPKQKELEQILAENKRLKEEKEREIAEREKAQMDHQTKIAVDKMEKEVIAAFEKNEIPNSKLNLDRVVTLYRNARDNGMKDVTFDQCAKAVRKELQSDLEAMAERLPDEAFEKWIGDKILSKIKASTLKKAKSTPDAQTTVETAKTQAQSKPAPKVKKPGAYQEWLLKSLPTHANKKTK